jgi:lysozyme family protein
MSYFDKAIVEVLKHEGGLVDHPNDPGGITNFGISKRAYPLLNIKSLTKEFAIELYRRDYWSAWYDSMPYEVAAKTFDMAVNMGKAQAHKILQRAVGVVDDGVVGPKTVAATNAQNVDKTLANITEQQLKFYDKIIEKKPTSKVFLSGWTRRAEWHPTV